ncbi:MAG: HIT family protein [Cohaesibacter sp.]|jgi:diadenosine tetraphosphate (Ap4A) HIT family hydrolase|nr:HIT family protein [Cohaesibacter sp.]
MAEFTLDPQLEADSLPVCELELCTVRLAKDANYPWLIMVPKYAGLEELVDLAKQDQHRLTDEIAALSTALRAVTGCDKLNVAALGNMVRQLHIHVIARFESDKAWPGPIWGKVEASSYEDGKADQLISGLLAALSKK